MLDRWFKKEKPLQGLTGMGGGVVSRVLGGGASGPLTATGGDTTFDTGGYRYHVFTTSTPAPQSILYVTAGADNLRYLVVAGGGGVGPNGPGGAPGGGGGGGFRTNVPGETSGGGASAEPTDGVPVTPGNIPVSVGAGGAGQGTPSWFGPSSSNKLIESIGGGASMKFNGGGTAGGSGGGARKLNTGSAQSGYPGTAGQGYAGGPNDGATSGGGGGGAGGAGSGGGTAGPGQRATWVPSSYGTSGPNPGRYFAGGGGGHNPGGNGGGGIGGGGNWTASATANTGSGGGGAGGNGAAGIIFIGYSLT